MRTEILDALIGRETMLKDVAVALRECVQNAGLSAVGAHHVFCSDESEVECVDVFQNEFVLPLLPALGEEKKAAFRTSNLGARYEPCSAHIAEHHYAVPESKNSAKCVVIKINGHVSVMDSPAGPAYGPMNRYATNSSACGALHALLGGAEAPFADDLRAAFSNGGQDRIATLLDPDRVDPLYRYLIAAMVSARLQAARAAADVEDYREATPTLYLIASCLTLNRPGPDGEILCGYYLADYRDVTPTVEYRGLGDDPAAYKVNARDEGLLITCD